MDFPPVPVCNHAEKRSGELVTRYLVQYQFQICSIIPQTIGELLSSFTVPTGIFAKDHVARTCNVLCYTNCMKVQFLNEMIGM